MEIRSSIAFTAEFVEVMDQEFTPDFTVIGLHFGRGDPEDGGQHWNFSRSIPDEEDPFEGICTVKEIQQVTIYGGITRFEVARDHLICEFDDEKAMYTGTRRLDIAYDVTLDLWQRMQLMAEGLFRSCDFFKLVSHD
jgi:hypothetical protein